MKNLKEIFEKHNIYVNEDQESQFDLFFHHLIERNKQINLTALTEERDVLVKHFLDSVLPCNLFPENACVVDVGSGAGFPAIPLKIVRPDLSICMIDSLNKRVNFLNDVVKILQLSNISAVHARAEDFAKDNREIFDVATARAVAPLDTLVEYLLPFVKVGGTAIVYKSSKLDEELKDAQKAINKLGGKVEKIEEFNIDELGMEKIERRILVIRKIFSTPKKYPRSGNKPKLSPIR